MRCSLQSLLLLLLCDVALSLAPAARVTRRTALLAPAALLLPAHAADEPITYAALGDELIACRETGVCRVTGVKFTVESGEQGDALFVDGTRRPIIGIPVDDPNSDSSPYKLVAKLRANHEGTIAAGESAFERATYVPVFGHTCYLNAVAYAVATAAGMEADSLDALLEVDLGDCEGLLVPLYAMGKSAIHLKRPL